MHCVYCYLTDGTIAQASFQMNGMTVCPFHAIMHAPKSMLPRETLEFVKPDEVKPKTKAAKKKAPSSQ